ncbi:MAG: heterodisulfide reductase-related iron-sulfur binding cluster, partial [Candidatus Bathyarchaeia archaeon]
MPFRNKFYFYRDNILEALSFNRLTVTYHDPCNLGRVCGLYEPPRKIIESLRGVEFNEMERIKNNAWCCGAGGGVMAAYPEFMAWTANER